MHAHEPGDEVAGPVVLIAGESSVKFALFGVYEYGAGLEKGGRGAEEQVQEVVTGWRDVRESARVGNRERDSQEGMEEC